VEKRAENADKKVLWHVAIRLGKRRALGSDRFGQLQARYERAKARLRAKVEHPFHVVKNLFHHRKVRYRSLFKNTSQLFSLFTFASFPALRPFQVPPSGIERPQSSPRGHQISNLARSMDCPPMNKQGLRRNVCWLIELTRSVINCAFEGTPFTSAFGTPVRTEINH
jgi:hypothetical protein